jgi:hypothetical protein
MSKKHKINPFGKYALPCLVSCMWNWWSPIAETTIKGITYKITDGFIENQKKTYLLYKDACIVGKFNTVDEAKEFVKIKHNLFASLKNDLYLYNLNPYNQN